MDDASSAKTRNLRVMAATPIEPELAELITKSEPRIDFVHDASLLPPQRFAGDHSGDPSFVRSPEQQCAFERLLDSADVLYGVPDESARALKRTADANERLVWVQTMAAGGGSQVRAAKLSSAQLERIAFSTSAGVHAGPLAEFAVFGLLAGAKTLPRLQEKQSRREWAERWQMGQLSRQTILVIGLGSIGRETARLLSGLGARVVGTSRRGGPVPFVDEIVHPDRLVDAVSRVDGIVVTLPGTPATRGMVSAEVLAATRPGVTLVNVGRGTVIDEDALVAALGDGRVGFAALDVFASEPLSPDSPLWSSPRALISPHTAALSDREDRLIAELFARNARRFLDGEPLLNRVDTVEFY